MWSIKTPSELTRGQEMTNQQITVWLLSTPACSQANHAMQQVSGLCYDGSEQHREVSNSRTNQDYEDSVMVLQYILPRSPFCPIKELINIHTGKVANRNVNTDGGYKIGLKITESMTGVNIDKFIFKKKDRTVINMKSESSIKLDNEEIFVDPMLLFQRLIASVQGIGYNVDVETEFSYELCSFPLALSKNNGYLRKADKAQLANAIWKCIGTCHITSPNCAHHVLDGWSLLHKVIWKKGMSYKEICKRYIDYVTKHYGQTAL